MAGKKTQDTDSPRVKLPKPTRQAGVPTGRYIECPGNRHMHEPRLVPLLRGPRAYFYRCTCTGNGFMAKAWQDGMGYTLDQALAYAKDNKFTVIGY